MIVIWGRVTLDAVVPNKNIWRYRHVLENTSFWKVPPKFWVVEVATKAANGVLSQNLLAQFFDMKKVSLSFLEKCQRSIIKEAQE